MFRAIQRPLQELYNTQNPTNFNSFKNFCVLSMVLRAVYMLYLEVNKPPLYGDERRERTDHPETPPTSLKLILRLWTAAPLM